MTKKTTHSQKAKKETGANHKREPVVPPDDTPVLEPAVDEPDLAADQFAVVAGGDEATSSGHRVEPVTEDDEHNAEKLIEEGLHGYLRASPNHTHRGR
jgi:hypothetical protein